MGIDHLTSFKCLRWAIKSERIDLDAEILFTYNHQLACLDQGQRWTPDDKLLKWQMTLPLAEPEVELVPFLIDWSQSAQHPTDKLPVQCQLLTLDVSTPNPSAAQDTFDKLFGLGELTIGHSAETRLIATLDTPNGVLRL